MNCGKDGFIKRRKVPHHSPMVLWSHVGMALTFHVHTFIFAQMCAYCFCHFIRMNLSETVFSCL